MIEEVVASYRSRFESFVRWVNRHRYEILTVLLITAVGAFLRTYRLDSIPAGIHGDEATNALLAGRILDGDWAAPYDPVHAQGRPAGFMFWLAGFIAVFGNSVFAIRLATATIAILTLPCAYLLFRAIDGKATAAIGASLLAFSSWHLIYSRMAWEPSMLVFAEVVAALFLVLALRNEKRWLFALAGAALGLGFYSHNSYPFFLIGVAALLAVWLVVQRERLPRALAGLATLAGTFLLTALPMLSFIRTHQDEYFRRSRSASIFNTVRFEAASDLLGRIDVVLDGGRDFVKLAIFEGPPDVPRIAAPVSVLLGLGLLYAARRWREPGVALAAIMVLVVPWAGILYPAGLSPMMRRTLGVTPFVALLAALPLAAALRSRYLAGPLPRVLIVGVSLGAIVGVGVTNGRFYFDDYADRTKINYPIMQASRFLADLPGDRYVYFYSSMWNYEHEIRRYLAPDVRGEDRSGYWGSDFDLTPDRSRDVVYVFIDAFLDVQQEVATLYPGGQAINFIDEDNTILFRAYELPRDPSVPPEDEVRDLARQEDLLALKEALERYRTEHGSYPDTGGQLQTLCIFRHLDAGCALTEVLSPLPEDPLGASSANGYWYTSTGAQFALYARRETDRLPACSEFLGLPPKLDSVICVRGP